MGLFSGLWGRPGRRLSNATVPQLVLTYTNRAAPDLSAPDRDTCPGPVCSSRNQQRHRLKLAEAADRLRG